MKSLKPTLLLLILALSFSQCRKDRNSAKANIQFETALAINNGATSVSIGDTLVMNTGYDFNLKKFKLYLSNITLIGAEDQVIRKIFLADVGDPLSGQFSKEIEIGNCSAVRLGFGLDPIQNDKNPEDFPDEHPLSSYNQMYWTMLKYRFAIMEGRSDINGALNGDTTDILNAYHPGLDSLYQVVEYPLDLKINENGNYRIRLSIMVDEIFSRGDGIDMRTEPQSHSEIGDSLNPGDFDIARKFMENLSASGRLEIL